MKAILYKLLLCLPLITLGQGFSQDQTYNLRVGQQISVGDHLLIFQEVSEDSRCPKGTECIWAGRAIVKLSVLVPDKQSKEHLAIFGQTKGGEKANMLVGQGKDYQIELKSLKPYPEQGVEMGTYTLKVVKRNQ